MQVLGNPYSCNKQVLVSFCVSEIDQWPAEEFVFYSSRMGMGPEEGTVKNEQIVTDTMIHFCHGGKCPGDAQAHSTATQAAP